MAKLYHTTGRRGIPKGCVKVEMYRLLMQLNFPVISDCITEKARLDLVVINSKTKEVLAIIWCKNIESDEIRKGKRYFKYDQYDCPLFVVPNLANVKLICYELIDYLRENGYIGHEKAVECKKITDNFKFNQLLF